MHIASMIQHAISATSHKNTMCSLSTAHLIKRAPNAKIIAPVPSMQSEYNAASQIFILLLHFFNPDLHSGLLLVVVHPATIVGGNDLAVVVLQHPGFYQDVRGRLDEVCQIDPAGGLHVVHAPHVHAGRDGAVRPVDLPQAVGLVIHVGLAGSHEWSPGACAENACRIFLCAWFAVNKKMHLRLLLRRRLRQRHPVGDFIKIPAPVMPQVFTTSAITHKVRFKNEVPIFANSKEIIAFVGIGQPVLGADPLRSQRFRVDGVTAFDHFFHVFKKLLLFINHVNLSISFCRSHREIPFSITLVRIFNCYICINQSFIAHSFPPVKSSTVICTDCSGTSSQPMPM
nr:MAG TPA: hypothetical protein [Caudoviricetes sp.]